MLICQWESPNVATSLRLPSSETPQEFPGMEGQGGKSCVDAWCGTEFARGQGRARSSRAGQQRHVYGPIVEKRLCVLDYSTSYHLATLPVERAHAPRGHVLLLTHKRSRHNRECRYQRYVCTYGVFTATYIGIDCRSGVRVRAYTRTKYSRACVNEKRITAGSENRNRKKCR